MIKIFPAIFVSILALDIYTQELNAEFLNSLPDGLAEDFYHKVNQS